MGNPFEEVTFFQNISLSSAMKGMDKLLFKIRHSSDDYIQRDLIPTLIEVKIPNNLLPQDIVAVRKFCKVLRHVQSRYFVRFGMSLLWSANTDNTDVFYTREENNTHHRDVTMTVRVLSDDVLELKVVVPFTSRQNVLIKELSRQMTLSIPAPEDTHNDQDALETMRGILLAPHIADIMTHIKEECHIFFIMSKDRKTYIPIPLFGLSMADAKRRYLASYNNLIFLDQLHHDTVPLEMTKLDAMGSIVNLIQDHEYHYTRSQASMESYALAELLFGYLVTTVRHIRPREVYLFDVDGPDGVIDCLTFYHHYNTH